jgi:predicted transcriptional regulator
MSDTHKPNTIHSRIKKFLEQGGEEAYDILEEGFVVEAVQALLEARQEAKLSQSEIARRLGTKQPSIARWESDFDGGISLRNYVEFAVACGKIPCDLTLVPIKEMLHFSIDQYDTPRTFDNFTKWKTSMNTSSLVSQNPMPAQTQSLTSVDNHSWVSTQKVSDTKKSFNTVVASPSVKTPSTISGKVAA